MHNNEMIKGVSDMEKQIESTSTQEKLLQQILDAQLKQVRYEKVRFIIAGIGLLIGIIALVIVLAGFSYIKTNIQILADEVAVTTEGINAVADKLREIDFKAIAESYQSLVSTAKDAVDQLKNDTKGISDFIEQTQTTMEDADAIFKSLSEVDLDSLNKGIEKFNEILTPLSNFFSVFNRGN